MGCTFAAGPRSVPLAPRPVHGYVVALRYSSLTARPLGGDRGHTRRAGGLAIPGSLLLALLPAVARFACRGCRPLARFAAGFRRHRTTLPLVGHSCTPHS